MASSLGYILMNWTAEFARHSKEKRRRRKDQLDRKNQPDNPVENGAKIFDDGRLSKAVHAAAQTEETICLECLGYAESLSRLENHLDQLEAEKLAVENYLGQSKNALALNLEREQKLRDDFDGLQLEEAQLRYELQKLQQDLSAKLAERDEAHSERIQLMEKLLEEKGIEWARRNEDLQRELRQALRSSLHDAGRETQVIKTLENEISSLHTVIEMRSIENRDLRGLNNELVCRLERQSWLESELNNTRQRLEELSLVLQNKMASERELLELSETLQQQLVHSREEVLHYRRELENRKYLYDNNLKNRQTVETPFDGLSTKQQQRRQSEELNRPHRNQHQQASCGANVIEVKEKTDSVSWMLELPPANNDNTIKRQRK